MANPKPTITENDIKQLSNSQSFERGRNYYRSGAILEPVRQGSDLRAYCEGSDYQPYRITVTLSSDGIESTHCTCPYDWGGICKHRVALLLAWVHQPDSFHTVPPLDETLQNRSKEELIALIKLMLEREPDLARLLELPTTPDRQTPLDLDAYRRQIAYALKQYDYSDYPYTHEVAAELETLVNIADQFKEAGDWEHAGTIYALVLDEVSAAYDEMEDRNGDVAMQLQRCAESLDDCFFEGEPEAETRRMWLSALLQAHMKDMEMGGVDLAYPAGDLVIGHATDEEWHWIEAQVQEKIDNLSGTYTDWERRSLVGFLTQRLEIKGQEDQIDDLILEQGTPEQQAFLLLEREQFDQAVEIAREHFTGKPGLVTRFADVLVEAGAGERAETYIIDQLGADTRSRHSYLKWLANHAQREGRLAEALERWQEIVEQTPRLDTYRAVQKIAEQLGQWSALRPDLLEKLEEKEAWSTLLEIALDEEDTAWALELLPNLRSWHGRDYALRVAELAEKSHPEEAIRIYAKRAEALISGRGRDNYQGAAQLLFRVRNLYRQQDQQEAWQDYIKQLRRNNSNLPALQDELNKAGL